MIHIVTVYDSLNYGSFFQAYALQKELSKYESTDYLDIHHQSIRKETLNYAIKKIIKLKFKDANLAVKKYLIFKNEQKRFVTTNINDIKNDNLDLFVFGSDEIWNISRDKIKKSKEFFGAGIKSKRKFSYAPSINTTTLEQIQKNEYIKDELNEFIEISVRDTYSKNIISKFLNRDIKVVCDPTLLLQKEDFKNIQVNMKKNNYILLYTYGKMLNNDVIRKIKMFARENGLKIISIGKYFSFCDECIAASPKEFLGYIDNAKYVFTDTFHGTIFSIIYEKNFLVFPCGNIKVEEILKQFDLLNRMISYDKNYELEYIVNNKINYLSVNKIKEKMRNNSKEYIKDLYNKCNEIDK